MTSFSFPAERERKHKIKKSCQFSSSRQHWKWGGETTDTFPQPKTADDFNGILLIIQPQTGQKPKTYRNLGWWIGRTRCARRASGETRSIPGSRRRRSRATPRARRGAGRLEGKRKKK